MQLHTTALVLQDSANLHVCFVCAYPSRVLHAAVRALRVTRKQRYVSTYNAFECRDKYIYTNWSLLFTTPTGCIGIDSRYCPLARNLSLSLPFFLDSSSLPLSLPQEVRFPQSLRPRPEILCAAPGLGATARRRVRNSAKPQRCLSQARGWPETFEGRCKVRDVHLVIRNPGRDFLSVRLRVLISLLLPPAGSNAPSVLRANFSSGSSSGSFCQTGRCSMLHTSLLQSQGLGIRIAGVLLQIARQTLGPLGAPWSPRASGTQARRKKALGSTVGSVSRTSQQSQRPASAVPRATAVVPFSAGPLPRKELGKEDLRCQRLHLSGAAARALVWGSGRQGPAAAECEALAGLSMRGSARRPYRLCASLRCTAALLSALKQCLGVVCSLLTFPPPPLRSALSFTLRL